MNSEADAPIRAEQLVGGLAHWVPGSGFIALLAPWQKLAIGAGIVLVLLAIPALVAKVRDRRRALRGPPGMAAA